MAKKGYIIEKRISAKDVEALNRSAVSTEDIDGGTLVSLEEYSNGVFTAKKSTGGLGNYMAYNPSEHLVKVGDNYATISKDPRDYTNLASRTFDVFKPQTGVDVIGITDGNIAIGQTIAVGSFLEQGTAGYEAKATSTAGTTSFKVIAIENQPFPQAGIGMENAKVYVCEVAQN